MNEFGFGDLFLHQILEQPITADWTPTVAHHESGIKSPGNATTQPPCRWSTTAFQSPPQSPWFYSGATSVAQLHQSNGVSRSLPSATLARGPNAKIRTFACHFDKADVIYQRKHSCAGVSATKMAQVRTHLTAGRQPHLPFLGFCTRCREHSLNRQEFEKEHGYQGEHCNHPPNRRRGGTTLETQWKSLFRLIFPAIVDVPDAYNLVTDKASSARSNAAYTPGQDSDLRIDPSISANLATSSRAIVRRATANPDQSLLPALFDSSPIPNMYPIMELDIDTEASMSFDFSEFTQDGSPHDAGSAALNAPLLPGADESEFSMESSNTAHNVAESALNEGHYGKTDESENTNRVSDADQLVMRTGPSISSVSSNKDSSLLSCPSCSTTFHGKYRKGNLARHSRLRHVNTEKCGGLYSCSVEGCGRRYERADARLRHHRKRHPELGLNKPIPRKARLEKPIVRKETRARAMRHHEENNL